MLHNRFEIGHAISQVDVSEDDAYPRLAPHERTGKGRATRPRSSFAVLVLGEAA